MISRAQQILLKRAQAEAGITDADYRAWLMDVAGCQSSKDARLNDRHIDKLLGIFEAVFWQAVDVGALSPSTKTNAVFRARGFWAQRNTREETSRDRFAQTQAAQAIADLETALAQVGCHGSYVAAIRANIYGSGQPTAGLMWRYKAALERTLAARRKKMGVAEPDEEIPSENVPF